MAWQDYLNPIEYTPFAQIVASLALGLIFSYFSVLLASVIFFVILYDMVIYMVIAHYDHNRWYLLARVGVMFAYIAGWIIGRSLLGYDIFVFNETKDNQCGFKLHCEDEDEE